MKYAISLMSFISALTADVRVGFAKSTEEIDVPQAKHIIVHSFMDAYEDIPLTELNPNFRSIGDVRKFYESYFDTEFEHFKRGGLYWSQAYINDELVGWATFELEPNEPNAVYMDLLIVDPTQQNHGIGKKLVFSILSEMPHIRTIYVLIRKINVEGEKFYRKIGFVDCEYTRDNFVDPALLTGIKWER